MPTKKKAKVTGSLNSKNPNPFEVAYKEMWDQLPDWKKTRFTLEIGEGRMTELHREFVKSVSRRAEDIYAKV